MNPDYKWGECSICGQMMYGDDDLYWDGFRRIHTFCYLVEKSDIFGKPAAELYEIMCEEEIEIDDISDWLDAEEEEIKEAEKVSFETARINAAFDMMIQTCGA